MTEYYDELLEEIKNRISELEQTKNRITDLEKNISIMHNNIITVSEQIKETQLYLIKLAKNQSDITKRVTQWPYLVVNTKKDDESDTQF